MATTEAEARDITGTRPTPPETDRDILRDLQRIPGVGPSIALDLAQLGIGGVAELGGRDPNELYETLCAQRGEHIDRCVLYVFRCAVHFAEADGEPPSTGGAATGESGDGELLKWWNWKDRIHPNECAAGRHR